jgi:pilus assembly protein CpaF
MPAPIFEQSLRFFLKPVADLLADGSVSEIMINGCDRIYVERGGKLVLTQNKFPNEAELLSCARNIAQFSGKRIDEKDARFDGRLADGSRVHVVLPPCARNGITISIRKFSTTALTLDKLTQFGSINADARALLEMCIHLDRNILVAGGTGSGKTQLLNALSGAIPGHDRVMVIEDTSELRLQQEHVVALEARAPDRHGHGAVTIRDLLHSALRLRPDRIIVGECRGGEALDMIQAMNSGHAGSMTTVHANAPRDALARIETLALMSKVELPLLALRAQVASAIQVLVQTDRLADGSRKVTFVAEVLPLDAQGRYAVQHLMAFEHQGRDPQTGKIQGDHKLMGRPTFWEEAMAKGAAQHFPRLVSVFGGGATASAPHPAPAPAHA